MELISSKDGKVRSARVMLPTKRILSRPLSLLYPLETSGTRVQNTDVNLEGDNLCHIDRHTESKHMKEESENNNTLKRLTRQAAQEARLRLRVLMNADDETIRIFFLFCPGSVADSAMLRPGTLWWGCVLVAIELA